MLLLVALQAMRWTAAAAAAAVAGRPVFGCTSVNAHT
jgi:hypothetical protein